MDRFQSLLIAHGDPAQNLPIEEGAERTDPGVIAERSESLTDTHHVGFGYSDVQGAPLIDSSNATLESAGTRQIRIDGNDSRIPCKHLHGAGDDVARAVFLALVYTRKKRLFIPKDRKRSCRERVETDE